MDEIVNKVAGSGIVTIDFSEWIEKGDFHIFDLRPALFMDQILKEKEFRDFVKNHDWKAYEGKMVGIICSADAIIPTWAYMLVSIALQPYAKRVFFGDRKAAQKIMFEEKLASFDPSEFKDARVVIKGCSDDEIPMNAYISVSAMLRPHVKSIMFGEPCSTVPLYKAKLTGNG